MIDTRDSLRNAKKRSARLRFAPKHLDQGKIYSTRVSMDRSSIQVEGRQVNLSPGIAVTVEIKTGQRRVIEYLLSPLLKSIKESLRKR